MKCKIADGKFVVEFDVETEKDIDTIVEELDLALKPSEIHLLKNSLSVYNSTKNDTQRFLFGDEEVEQSTINVEQNGGPDTDNRVNELFSKLGYDTNDENVKTLIQNFEELAHNKVLNFDSSTKPRMLLTFFSVFNYGGVVEIGENCVKVLNNANLFEITPTHEEHEDVRDVLWGVEKTPQLTTQEFAKAVGVEKNRDDGV